MKVSFSTLGCPRWSFQDICATARDLGYNGIEMRGIGKDISVPSIPEFAPEQVDETLAQLKRLNLSIPCLTSDCCLHLREQAAHVDQEVAAYLALAQKLGTPYVRVMAAAAVPQPIGQVDVGYVREHAQQLAEKAAAHGVTLLIETNAQWSDTAKLARLLEDIGSQNVAALWDVHHPFRYLREPAKASYENLKPWIRHVHLKDSVMEDGRVCYRMPGYGDLPLEEMVGLLKSGGFEGFYSLEWLKRWDLSLEEPGIVFAHFISFIRSL